MDTVSIFYIILLASASILCLALIFYINKIADSIKDMQSDINDLSVQVKPLIITATELSEKLNDLSAEAKEQVGTVKEIIGKVKDRVETILSLEEQLREGLEKPVNGLLKNLSAVSNGINTFWKTYKK
ncbi:MAG TPA: hypothetical protein VKD08_04200 [Ignavibacteriaceae bacterium]|jgi:uncharacterized protein YoxC|nr:hypothetical protein [Ignavibacteriaceae bacterium]